MVPLLAWVVGLACWTTSTTTSTANSPNAVAKVTGDTAGPVNLDASLGLEGNWKLGHVTPLKLRLTGVSTVLNEFTAEVTTIDGDGVEVTYRRPFTREETRTGGGAMTLWMPIRIGRIGTPLTVRIWAQQSVIFVRQWQSSELPPALPSTQPLVLCLGSSLGVEAANSTSVLDGNSNYSICVISEAAQLPDDWATLASCDMLVISTANLSLLESIRAKQWQALNQWVLDGGVCVASLSRGVRELERFPDLKAMIAGRVTDIGRVTNPGPLESFVSTDKPIDEFETILMEFDRGVTDLQLIDSRNRRLPWMHRAPHGMGIVQTVASDLDQPALADWPDRLKLWKFLLNRYVERSSSEQSQRKKVGDTSYLGYDDLVGQLRATLDVFPSVTPISFGIVVVSVLGLLFVIGPIDYLLSVKLLKRPEVSWIFAGLSLTAICVGLIYLRNTYRPDEILVNTVQLVDIDINGGKARGTLWSHVYSGSSRQVRVSAAAQSDEVPVMLDWQGLPGKGLGGLLSQLDADRTMPMYRIETNAGHRATFASVAVPAAGTKCITGVWHQDFANQATSQLREIQGIDQLEGSFTNPLPVDLKDGMLLYHNWYYSLPSRIPAGQTMAITYEMIPKDLPRRLNGRRVVEGAERTTPWNPADRESLPRLLEMLMFYKAGSGPTYTTLQHRYQPHLDLSNLLGIDCAIIVGRVDQPWVRMQVDGDSIPEVRQEVDQTWCRIIVPVQTNQKK